jgi:SAM-dependent methyltransferase
MPPMTESLVWRGGRFLLAMGDPRPGEYAFTWKFMGDCQSMLDVGCGTGTFCEMAKQRSVGIDINPDNVEYCRRRGIRAQVGSALDLPFSANNFDGVHCSHVLQVFNPNEAVKCLQELARVTKPGGIIVITTLSDFKRFWRHPENVRPYPPDALHSLLNSEQRGASSPMWAAIPKVDTLGIRLRHPPLIEFAFRASRHLMRVSAALNGLQMGLGLKKYWAYNSYTLALRKL